MQTRLKRSLATLTAVSSLSMAACGFAPTATPTDLETIMSWWDGDYDNATQIQSLLANGDPVWRADGSGKGGHIEVTSHYRPIELPAFGDHVIYVEETKHGDPTSIFRQRIYTLAENADQVRVKLWYFKDKEAYVGAWRDLDKLADLTPDAMSPLPDNCDLLSKREGTKFHFAMPDKACVFGERYFNYQVLLGADSFWFRDQIVRVADDQVLETAGDFTYHRLERR